MKRKHTHRHRGQTWWLPRGGTHWEFGMRKCPLLPTEWMSNKALLYSTEDHIQYPVINYNGQQYEEECITQSLCCTAKINTIL